MRYLIDFINNATNEEINNYLSQNGYTVVKQWNNFEKVYLVEGDNVPPASSLVERHEEENTLALTPHAYDFICDVYHQTHTDPSLPDIAINTNDEKDWWKNFSYHQPNFEDETYTIKRLGDNITVYIMDSGIEANHPEFSEADINLLYSVTPGDFTDHNGHGTALAGVIVGKTCGITNAKVNVVKIFDSNHATTQSEFLDALDAILENHAQNTFGVINCSWSVPRNEWIEHKLALAIAEGMYVLAAAGNTGTPIDDVTPASMMDVLTVGAYDQNLEPCDFSDYTGPAPTGGGVTNHGELDGWAPGEKIWSADLEGGYGYFAGTSMATAITSAVVISNLSWLADSQGMRYTPYSSRELSTNSDNVDGQVFTAFRREDLLDLSDPKYANSKNRIATIFDSSFNRKPQYPDEIPMIWYAGYEGQARIFSPGITKKLSTQEPLPENFHFTQNGLLWGKPTAAQGPQNGEHYKLYTINLVRTDINDVDEQVTLNVYVFEENKDFNDIPSDDPVIPITLLAVCGGFRCVAGSATGCQDVCPYGCCIGTKSNSFQCRCDPG